MYKNNQEVKIRKMDMSDVPFVYKFETVSFGQMIEEKALYEEIIENKIARYYIALIEGKRVGYIGGWMPKPNAEIITIFVKNGHRKQKVGSTLLTYLVESFKMEKIDSITLEVRVSNTPAIELYQSFGFEIVSCRKNYYKDGEDAHMMYMLIGGSV